MEITILGYVLIPIAIYIFIKKEEMLLYFMIFFAPFSASSVINIKSITFGLSPAYLFLLLWIIKKIILIFNKKISLLEMYNNIKKDNYNYYKFINIIVIFMVIILISLFMPIIFEGKVFVLYPDKGSILHELAFKRIHITQTLYFLLMLIIPIAMIFEEFNIDKIKKIFYIICFSVLFCDLWGIYQVISKILGLYYPWQLFNNNLSYKIGKFIQVFHGIPRISSVAPEPSVYSFYLVMIIGILIGILINSNKIINKRLLNLSLIFSFISLILTFSTTAYICIVFLLLFILYSKINNKNIKQSINYYVKSNYKTIICIFIILLIFILFVLYDKNFKSLLYDITINKLNTNSGNGRLYGMKIALNIFIRHPVLGVGWGSNRSFDLITTLLSNIGIVGFCTFVLMQYYVIYLIKDIKNITIKNSLLYSLFVGLFAYSISIPDIVFIHFWIIYGIAVTLSYNKI